MAKTSLIITLTFVCQLISPSLVSYCSILDSPNTKSNYETPTTCKKSEEMVKLNLIWNSIPNGKVGQNKTSSKKVDLSNTIKENEVFDAINTLTNRYQVYLSNGCYLAMVISKDIENSINYRNFIGKENIRLENNRGCYTTGNCSSKEYNDFTESFNKISVKS